MRDMGPILSELKQLRAERDSFQRVGIHTLTEFIYFLEEISDLWDVHEIHYRAAAIVNKFNNVSELKIDGGEKRKMARFDFDLAHTLEKPKPYPNAECQWCGDTGEFEDDEGQTWPCVTGCKPQAIDANESA